MRGVFKTSTAYSMLAILSGLATVAGDTNDEQIAARTVKRVFRRDPRIRAAENRSVRILSADEGLALGDEVVPSCDAFLISPIALHQARQRVVRSSSHSQAWAAHYSAELVSTGIFGPARSRFRRPSALPPWRRRRQRLCGAFCFHERYRQSHTPDTYAILRERKQRSALVAQR